MNSHADKAHENKSQAIGNSIAVQRRKSESEFDQPEIISQGKFQQIANESQQVKQSQIFQAMANTNQQEKNAAKAYPSHQQPIQQKKNATGLPDQLKTGIENLSGYLMDDVKVHFNSDKPASLKAHAYAQGTAIHVAPGQEKYLPHEAWHVVQQKQGRVKPSLQMKGGMNINIDKGLEKEADDMGNAALQLKSVRNQSGQFEVNPLSESPIQLSVIQFSLVGAEAEKLSNIFVKWVTKHLKSPFTAYFLSQLDGALMAFYDFDSAYEYLESLVKNHAEYVGVFQNATLGKKLGEGSEKDVYSLVEHPNVVMGISTSEDVEGAIGRLREEVNLLNTLALMGIPVAEVIGIIDYKGRAAVVMTRYAEGSKGIVTNDKENFNAPVRVGNSAHLNAKSIEDLNLIMKKFQKEDVQIDDIQFLIGADGTVVVSDPLAVRKGKATPNMLQMINRLVETAAENELRKLLDAERRPFTEQELLGQVNALGVDPFLGKRILKGLVTNYSTMIKWDSGTNTFRYSSFEEVD